jgi:membrane protein implicated in regulation of membrane protease activity
VSLIGFHRLLITTGILFCLGFAMWETRAFLQVGGSGTLLLGVTFAVLGVGLILYLRRLNRILGYETDGG